MNLLVRRATVEDAEQACTVLRRSIVECCIEDHRGDEQTLKAWLRNKTPETVGAWFGESGSYAVVAEYAGAVVGVAMFSVTGKVLLCYLVPEVRHRGVGKAMMVALEEEAYRRGLSELSLSSTRTGYAFYVRNGYVDGGKSESAFGLECRCMRKRIANVQQA